MVAVLTLVAVIIAILIRTAVYVKSLFLIKVSADGYGVCDLVIRTGYWVHETLTGYSSSLSRLSSLSLNFIFSPLSAIDHHSYSIIVISFIIIITIIRNVIFFPYYCCYKTAEIVTVIVAPTAVAFDYPHYLFLEQWRSLSIKTPNQRP